VPELSARAAALSPPHAYGAPTAVAEFRAAAEDFRVEEDLGFAPAGAGAHLLLKVRKVNANTAWVARELARLALCRPHDVGYAGLKDRRAVAVQWFSVPLPRTPVDFRAAVSPEFSVLEAHAHNRKLPRGALAGNRFSIRLRPCSGSGAQLAAALAPRLAAIRLRGVPNYFGPQRFGRDGANLERLAADTAALHPAERGFVLSAARSVIFNAVLAERVAAGGWELLQAGDLAALEGRGSFFTVNSVDEELAARAARPEIHPTGPMWGQGEAATHGDVAALEAAVAARYVRECLACTQAGMRQERRSLRLAVHELTLAEEPDALLVSFRLGRGSFATAVLRELLAAAAELPDSG
jgi:tRNA pseudouridine13 synthase